ncbi:hypothetical protein SprV_0200539700 [Sparganum proliferum]
MSVALVYGCNRHKYKPIENIRTCSHFGHETNHNAVVQQLMEALLLLRYTTRIRGFGKISFEMEMRVAPVLNNCSMLVEGTLWGLTVFNCSLRIPSSTVEFTRMKMMVNTAQHVCCKLVSRFSGNISNLETSVLASFTNTFRRGGNAAVRRLHFHGLEENVRRKFASNQITWEKTVIGLSTSLANAAFSEHAPLECVFEFG